MLKRVEGEVRSPRPGVERPFLLLFVTLNLCTCIDGRRDIVTGAADVRVWKVHHYKNDRYRHYLGQRRVNIAKWVELVRNFSAATAFALGSLQCPQPGSRSSRSLQGAPHPCPPAIMATMNWRTINVDLLDAESPANFDISSLLPSIPSVSASEVQTLSSQIKQLLRGGDSEGALRGALENAPYGGDAQAKVSSRPTI